MTSLHEDPRVRRGMERQLALRRWVRGGTWTHELRNPRIGLVSLGGAGHTADFDYVRVYRLAGGRRDGDDRRRLEDARPPRAGRTPRSDRPLRLREQLPPRR